MSLMYKSLVVLVCVLMAACSEPPTQTLRIGTNVWPGYEPLYLARELGYFKDEEIRLVEYTSASQVIKAYRNGLLDAAALTLDEAISLYDSGENVRVVLAMDVSDGADALLGQATLKSLEDIKGKKIGVEHTALGAYFVARIVEFLDLDKKDISIVPLEVNQHERAFKEKQVDAVITFDPARSKIIEGGGKVLFDSSQIPGEIVDVLIVRAEKLEMFESNIRNLKWAWFKAVKNIQHTPEKFASVIDKRMRVGEENVKHVFDGLAFPDKDENLLLLSKTAEKGLHASSQKMAEIMYENGLISKQVSTGDMFATKN